VTLGEVLECIAIELHQQTVTNRPNACGTSPPGQHSYFTNAFPWSDFAKQGWFAIGLIRVRFDPDLQTAPNQKI